MESELINERSHSVMSGDDDGPIHHRVDANKSQNAIQKSTV